jgi:hypothetical protein
MGRGLAVCSRGGAGLELFKSLFCGLGIVHVLWGLVDAVHLGGVVLGGDGGIHVKGMRDRV